MLLMMSDLTVQDLQDLILAAIFAQTITVH